MTSNKKPNRDRISKQNLKIIRNNNKRLRNSIGFDDQITQEDIDNLQLYHSGNEIQFDPINKQYQFNIAVSSKQNAAILTKKLEAAGLLYEFQNLDEMDDIKKTPKGQEALGKTYNKTQLKKIFKVDLIDSYESPYTPRLMDKFHDVSRVDSAYNKAIEADNDFVLGNEYPKLILDTNKSYPTSIMESYDLNRIRNNFVYFSIKNSLERIDRNIGLRDKITAFRYQFRTYGRACIHIHFDEKTRLPIGAVVLNSKSLGHIFVDKLTHKVIGVEYYDLPSDDNKNILTSDEIIYYANRDYGQTPKCFGFGYADPELIINFAETNVIINAVDLKEINKSEWMPFYIISVIGNDPLEVNRIQRLLNVGKRVLTRNKVEVNTIDNKHDGSFMLEERDSNDKKIVSGMRTMGLVVDEKVEDNHATAMVKAQIYNQTVVKRSQLILRDIFETQWYWNVIRRLINFRLAIYDKSSEIRKWYEENIKEMNRNYKKDVTPTAPALRFTNSSGALIVNEAQAIENDRQTWREWQKQYVDWKLTEIEKTLLENQIVGDEAKSQVYDSIKEELESLLNKISNPDSEETDNDIDKQEKQTLSVTSLFDESNESTSTSKKNERFGVPKTTTKEDTEGNKKTQPNDKKNEPINDRTGNEDDESRDRIWITNNFPSPSDINFEIKELEKLIIIHPVNYDFKVKMAFTAPSIVTELERSAYVSKFIETDFIPKNYGRKIMGYNDLIEDEKIKEGNEFIVSKKLRELDLSLLEEQRIQNEQFQEIQDQFDPLGEEQAKEAFKAKKQQAKGKTPLGRKLDSIQNQGSKKTPRLNKSSAS